MDSYTDTDATIEIELEDGTKLECDILMRFPIKNTQYIALAPIGSDEILENVYLYRFSEGEDGEPILTNIEDDEEYEIVVDKFDEILDEFEYEDAGGDDE